MNSSNPVDQDQPIPTEEEQEEFVPPERLIAQASSTPHSPPIPTNNLFDPLGNDDESTVEDDDNESIARRIQEQYDLEAALEASAAEAGVEPEPANVEIGGSQQEEGVGEAAASSAGHVERDRTRRQGCWAGAKHLPGRENLAYGTTCEYIRAQLGDSTYARFGRRFNLPLISPHIARKQYPEWFAYVLRHSDRWAFDTEGELLPVDTILRRATILPELWQFLYSINPTLLQGTPQPQYRLPKGYWSSDHLFVTFVPLRHVRSAETRVAPPRTVFNSDSKAASSAAPPRADRSRSAAPEVATASTAATSAAAAGSTWRPSLDCGQSAVVLTPIDPKWRPRPQRPRPESPSRRQQDRSLSLKQPVPSQSKPQPLARALRRSLPLSPFHIVRLLRYHP